MRLDACEFTDADVLKTELTESAISGKQYRVDQQMGSAVSSKTEREFILCHETRQPIARAEAFVQESTIWS